MCNLDKWSETAIDDVEDPHHKGARGSFTLSYAQLQNEPSWAMKGALNIARLTAKTPRNGRKSNQNPIKNRAKGLTPALLLRPRLREGPAHRQLVIQQAVAVHRLDRRLGLLLVLVPRPLA